MLDRETFRAAVSRVKERTGQKGKALFHPIRLALTGEPEGLELDLRCRRSSAARVLDRRRHSGRAAASPSAPRACGVTLVAPDARRRRVQR